MFWRIEVENKDGIFDAQAEAVKKDIKDLRVEGIKGVKVKEVYILYGRLKEEEIKDICEHILVDKITQSYVYFNTERFNQFKKNNEKDTEIVEVAYSAGVMDPWEASITKAVCDLGISSLEKVKTARQYIIRGELSKDKIDYICEKVLYNKLIQHIKKEKDIYNSESYLKKESLKYKFKKIDVEILNASEDELLNISGKGQLYLNLDEMKMIQRYFRNSGRKPTDCELETIAQTWSEHCSHKTFRGLIEYDGKIIDNLLKSTIMQATRILNKDWCVSVFEDNSGIITFDDKHNICFKVETHNHPSALEPYGGSSTGVGGVIRDPLGTGLGAKPIANTDIFCFGPPDYPHDKLPKGTMHPMRIIKGVVSGVRDYGNRMGIPTVNGAVLFNEGYVGNPLVYCGNVGIMPSDKSFKKIETGDLIVVVGGRTGRDGIHGATFSSGELTHESEKTSYSAVQIGNAITEKKMTDVILKARDKNLYKAITDCGAGGLSSAVGETASETGAKVFLEKAPLKYDGLTYTEIWISESQERMVLGVDRNKVDELLNLCLSEDVEATVIGEYTDTKRLELYYYDHLVCDMDMEFLHNGLPRIKKEAVWIKPNLEKPHLKEREDYTEILHKLLSTYDISSKEWIIRQYDHEVQAQTILKPLGGKDNDGPNDAACIKPLFDSDKGIIISCGINPYYAMIDSYWMAINVIDEALRQIIASGGNLDKVAILDNFCWGSPDDPEQLGSLVRAAIGCHDASLGYEVPFISGKDSLNNEYRIGEKKIAIPPTLLISAMGVIDDIKKTISSDLKEAGNPVYMVGKTKDELGASAYYRLKGYTGANLPVGKPKESSLLMQTLAKATDKRLVASCHDCSEGGLAVTLSEMAFSGGLGLEVDLKKVPIEMSPARDDRIIFSESMTRFVVEVKKDKKDEFEHILKDITFGLIGEVKDNNELKIKGLDGKVKILANINDLKESWQKPLRW